MWSSKDAPPFTLQACLLVLQNRAIQPGGILASYLSMPTCSASSNPKRCWSFSHGSNVMVPSIHMSCKHCNPQWANFLAQRLVKSKLSPKIFVVHHKLVFKTICKETRSKASTNGLRVRHPCVKLIYILDPLGAWNLESRVQCRLRGQTLGPGGWMQANL